MQIFYLPDYHEFEHVAVAPWPNLNQQQQDWVDSMTILEEWLNKYVGAHYAQWAYAQQQNLEYWQACVAFKQAKHKTLFLLTWTQ